MYKTDAPVKLINRYEISNALPFRNNVLRFIKNNYSRYSRVFHFFGNQENQSRYGKLYTADEKGNKLSFVGFIDVSVRKECPNCFVFFIKNDNLHSMHEKNGDLVSRFYVCPACGCRIKHHV